MSVVGIDEYGRLKLYRVVVHIVLVGHYCLRFDRGVVRVVDYCTW